MNICSRAGQRLYYAARCSGVLAGADSVAISGAFRRHISATQSSRDSGSGGSLSDGTSFDLPHPPFDLTSRSDGSSVVGVPSVSHNARHFQPAVSASQNVIARAQSDSESILDALAGTPRHSNQQGSNHSKKTKKKAKKRPTEQTTQQLVTALPASSASPNKGPSAPLHETSQNGHTTEASSRSGWEGEKWNDNWGDDKLKPTPEFSTVEKTRSSPPHIAPRRTPLSYSRRIEGLLDPADTTALEDLPPPSEHKPIAKLAHGLDRVLFNPGVHWLQDPRSRVYNFSPWLENIPKVTDFAFERLAGFIKSSRDEDLWELAKRENRTFAGSTSSLTGMLSQVYFLISGDRNVDTSTLSRHFAHEPTTFTPGQRMPASVIMNYNDGVYSIDSDSDKAGDAEKNILTWMGTLLEKYLTMDPDEFTTYMRSAPPPPEEDGEPMREAYRYAKSQRFVMRSQLDCQDSRLPGTGVFDIKTRACLPIRLDILNFEENSGYLIRTQHGSMESFEKEYYDLIRSAFLKYSFQARIGNMDGVIVAYHNTARMFGFQYIPLEEMDERLFGPGQGIGNRVFEKCIGILESVADEIILCFPKQSVKCTFETEEGKDVMNVWVEPAEWSSSKERPIKQLEVKVSNFLDQDPVKGPHAVSSTDTPWTIHWSIARLTGKDIDVRDGLNAAKSRQFRAYNIPTGVGIETIAEFWEKLNFSGRPPPEDQEKPLYKAENFRSPSRNVQMLRSVARSGREETERLALEQWGKPKVVLGEPESIPADVIQAADNGSYSGIDTTPLTMDVVADDTDVSAMETASELDSLNWNRPTFGAEKLDASTSELSDDSLQPGQTTLDASSGLSTTASGTADPAKDGTTMPAPSVPNVIPSPEAMQPSNENASLSDESSPVDLESVQQARSDGSSRDSPDHGDPNNKASNDVVLEGQASSLKHGSVPSSSPLVDRSSSIS